MADSKKYLFRVEALYGRKVLMPLPGQEFRGRVLSSPLCAGVKGRNSLRNALRSPLGTLFEAEGLHPSQANHSLDILCNKVTRAKEEADESTGTLF